MCNRKFFRIPCYTKTRTSQNTFIFINSESNFMPAWVCGIVMRWSYFSMPIETDFRGREACRRNAANYARTTKMRKGFVIEIIV